MSEPVPTVLDLDAARAARVAEVERREALRPFVVVLTTFTIAVLPPGADPDMQPASEVLDAADFVDDRGRLGEIARAMVARVTEADGVQHGG